MAELILREDGNTIELKINGKKQCFSVSDFTDDEINTIKSNRRCGGCKTFTSFGFKYTNKRSWCSLSHKIAHLQDMNKYM